MFMYFLGCVVVFFATFYINKLLIKNKENKIPLCLAAIYTAASWFGLFGVIVELSEHLSDTAVVTKLRNWFTQTK